MGRTTAAADGKRRKAESMFMFTHVVRSVVDVGLSCRRSQFAYVFFGDLVQLSSNFGRSFCKLLVLANHWVFLPPKVVILCTSTWMPKALQYIAKSRRWSWRNICRQGWQSRVHELDNDDSQLVWQAFIPHVLH